MIKNIRHIGIVVDDIDISLDFYQRLLGFSVIKKEHEDMEFINKILNIENVEITTIKMISKDGQMIELLSFHPNEANKNKSICNIGITHIAFTVENVDREFLNLKNEGVIFLSNPKISKDKHVKVVFCRSPEGAFIELVEIL